MMIYVIACLVLFFIGMSIIAFCNIVIKRRVLTVYDNKIDKDIDIVFVSDLHVGANNKKKQLNKIISMINEYDCDCVLIGGDIVGKNILKYYKDSELRDIFDCLKVKKRYFVKGNHDDFSLSLYDDFTVLNDESVKLSDNVVLTGLKWEKGECIDNKLNKGNYNILFSHYPDRVEEYFNVDLALGAHSHGNQINLPFCKFHHKEKYTRGLYTLDDNRKLYVNRGLGFSLLKIRVFSCREIVKIELRKGENNGDC